MAGKDQAPGWCLLAIHKEVNMPRPQRFQVAGVPQHVVQRGVNRQAVFFTDNDREFFLETLAESASWYDMHVHAYCLMTNHIHLLVTPVAHDALSHTMRRLGGLYAAFVNKRHGRTGSLWGGRFRSCLVDSERYFLVCQRYIELNPVRARIVDTPADYHWSSYGHNGLGVSSPLVTPHATYSGLGSTSEQRCANYRDLFAEVMGANELQSVRNSLQQNHVFGSDRFKWQMETMLARKLHTGKRGRPKNAPSPNAGKSANPT
ncbi:MAG: putative transposase [Gammaproteobacteria bacterium]